MSRIENMLTEILTWIRVGNLQQLRNLLAQELDSSEKMRIFELTDGIKSQQEVASLTGVSRSTISYYWQKWYGLGILTTSNLRKGRMKKIVSLDEVAIAPYRGQKVEEKQITFQPQDLKEILDNQTMFTTNQELADFAYGILPMPNQNAFFLPRNELIDGIIKTFKDSDHMKQALFMQALERRAYEKKDTQFKRFFEAWEKQIRT